MAIIIIGIQTTDLNNFFFTLFLQGVKRWIAGEMAILLRIS